MPEMAVANSLFSTDIPKEIADLNWIELMCIQRVRPIQVIFFFNLNFI